jgi:hypothetical protein
MRRDSIYPALYDLGKVRDTRRSESICKFRPVKDPTSLLIHSPQGCPSGGVKCSILRCIGVSGLLWQRQPS